jgi:hypothetical protein
MAEITTRSADQFSFSFGVPLNEEIDLHPTEQDASPLVAINLELRRNNELQLKLARTFV